MGIIRLNGADNVVIALADLAARARSPRVWTGRCRRRCRAATRSPPAPIATGEKVIRYGQIIGQATDGYPGLRPCPQPQPRHGAA